MKALTACPSFYLFRYFWLATLTLLLALKTAHGQADYSQAHKISTLAGSIAPFGSTDGTGSAASFYIPNGVAVDGSGNVYVADQSNHKIRKITAAGVVTTLAGSGTVGAADGTGSAASFYNPSGVTVDSSGNVYVADQSNNKIRKITAAGVVTTLSGSGNPGSVDGTGSGASFSGPHGLAVDSSGNVYVADSGNRKIRKVTAAGLTTTLAGSGTYGSADGTGTEASFSDSYGVAVDSSGNVYVADVNNNKIRKITATGVVTTLAGSGFQGSADGTGSGASFKYPSGVAVASNGTVYVSEIGNYKIRRITATGVVTTFAGSGNSGSMDGTGIAASFGYPSGVAIDSSGNIYVADHSNHKIRKVTAAGVVTTLAGRDSSLDGVGSAASFYNPSGVAVDSSGNVYVADLTNHKIRKITAAGMVTTLAGSGNAGSADGTGSAASLNDPIGVTVDSSGNVYVADQSNHKIRKITAAGSVTTLAGSGNAGSADGTGSAASFNYPRGVAVDSSGNVYVADTNNHKIRKITPVGVVTTLAGSVSQGSADGTGSAASFYNPFGVAVDSSGNVYVADQDNHKIRKITAAGMVTTLAGSGSYGSADGTGSAARFDYPSGVAVDSSGNVYVVEYRYNRIRKISAAGVVTTLAGGISVPGSTDGAGSAARFYSPRGVAVDTSGNIYVADTLNHKIRKGIPMLQQTISFSSLADFAYGVALPILTASSSSGLAVTYQVSGPASISNGNQIVISGVGTVVVTATQNGNTDYAPASSVVRSFQVSKGTQTISFGSLANRAYSTSPFVLAASAASGLPVSFQVVSGPATLSGSNLTMTGVGTVVVRSNQEGNTNYLAANSVDQSFSITQATQTLAFETISNRTFGQAAFSLSGTASSGLPISFEVVSGPATIVGTTCTTTGAGTVVIRALQTGNTNYSAAIPVERSFTVAKASQTLTFATLPPKNPTDPAFALLATSSSGLALMFSVISGPATVSGNVVTLTGSGTVVIRASQPGNENYLTASSVDQFFLVRSSQTINFPTPASRPLATSPLSLTATSSSGLAVSFSLISGPATLSGNSLTLIGTGTVVIKANQAGNATVAPAPEVTVSMIITINTAAPTAIVLSKSYFFDNVPNNSELAVLTALDPDVGDSYTYTLVSGTGSTDNAKFNIVGDRLRSATTFNYNTQRYLSIRVRATDSAGQAFEQVLQLQTIPRNPNASFIPGDTFTAPQNYVNSIFQLVGKSSGRGINYPKAFFDPASPDFQPNLFQAFEAASVSSVATAVPQSESYFQVAKMDEVKTTVRTILLIDNSSSISFADLAVIKSAAKIVVDKMFDQQEIAIYSFSGTHNLVANFTGKSASNQVSLKAAIDTIVRGSPTTNLYGSMLAMLNLTEWRESFSVAGIETGFLVVLTDGQDTSGATTEAAVIAKRNSDNKRIYTIGLGANIDPASLNRLQNTNLPLAAANSSELAAVFEQVQDDILDLANSFYWVNYSSPKRQSNPYELRRLEVKVAFNTNFASDGILSRTFDSQTFSDLPSALYINRKANLTEGISSLSIAKDRPAFASAITMYPEIADPAYTWSIGNPTLATLTPQGAVGERVIITPNNLNGSTTLTVTDTANNLPPKTIQLVIGTGVGEGLNDYLAAAGVPPNKRGPNDDGDGDGVSNLLEFAFNMNPASSLSAGILPAGGTTGLPFVAVDTSNPQPLLKIEFLRRKGSGLIYTPERATTLDQFTPMTGTQTVTSINAEWERVSVVENNPPTDPTSGFARVRVTLP